MSIFKHKKSKHAGSKKKKVSRKKKGKRFGINKKRKRK